MLYQGAATWHSVVPPPLQMSVCLSVNGAGREALGLCSNLTLEGSNLRAEGVKE